MILLNNTKTQLLRCKIYTIQHRTAFKASANTFTKIYLSKNTLNMTPSLQKSYATHRVHTPKPETNTAEGLANNPIVTLTRKNNELKIHHPEVVQQLCEKKHCEKVVCSTLCDEPLGPLTSVAMLTHSDIHGGVPFSTEDIDGNKRIQYCKANEKPHDTSKDSADIEKDKARTEQLKKIYFDSDNE